MASLVRTEDDRMIGGVSAAIARRFGWSITTTRIITVLAVLFTGIGLIAYVALWILIPAEGSSGDSGSSGSSSDSSTSGAASPTPTVG